jgi:hypothetical protein
MNDITIILTGGLAYDYIRKESKLEEQASNTLEENADLHLRILDLEMQLAELTANVSSYALEKAGANFRLKRDTALMEDSQYEKKSPFKKPIIPEEIPVAPTLDETWRAFVDAGEPAANSPKSHWPEDDSAVIENAVDKTDIKYYSVGALARFLNRSIPAIRTRAITIYGAHIRNGMIVSEI